jgi:predicted membrane chloride channel (bestrophin family)
VQVQKKPSDIGAGMNRIVLKKRSLLVNATITVLIVLGAKLVAHSLGWEAISLNPLFSGIVAANVFLMGFLLSGVLADYKESERLPGELAASIETIGDEAASIYGSKKAEEARQFLEYLLDLAVSIKNWFYKKEQTRVLMASLGEMTHHFVALEGLTQANFIARLKQEQSNIRRLLIRIHTVRETSFIPSGYIIAHATTLLLLVGLVLVKIDPIYESLFFVGVITFLLRFLGLLIQDLDNPFGYYEGNSVEDVSLKPLDDVIARLREMDGHLSGNDRSRIEVQDNVPVSRNHYVLNPRTL